MKMSVKLLSVLLAAVMILSMMTVSIGAEEKTYSPVEFIGRFEGFSPYYTDYGFAVDNQIFDADGKLLWEVPVPEDDDLMYYITLSGEYVELAVFSDDYTVYEQSLYDFYTGELLAGPEDTYAVYWTDGYMGINSDIYKDGEYLMSLPYESLRYIGDGLFLCLGEADVNLELGVDFSVPHDVYDIKTGETYTAEAGVLPFSFVEGLDVGISAMDYEEFYLSDRYGNPINDDVYYSLECFDCGDGNIYYIGLKIDMEQVMMGQLAGQADLIAKDGEVLRTWTFTETGMEAPVEMSEKWIITAVMDEYGYYFKVYDLDTLTTDGELYYDYAVVGEDSLVACGEEGNKLYNADDGSVLDIGGDYIYNVGGEHYVIEDGDTGERIVFDKNGTPIGEIASGYDVISSSPFCKDILIVEEEGLGGVIKYDGTVLIPAYGSWIDAAELENGNIFVSVECFDEETYEYYTDVYIIKDKLTPFPDVAAGAWYETAAKFGYDSELIVGYNDGRFGPMDDMSRAQVVSVLWRLAGSPESDYELEYVDVGKTWYTEAVRWATEEGITSGIGDGKFAPDDSITREQLAAMLYRYHTEYLGEEASGAAELFFTDNSSISTWAVDAVKWASGNGIVSGKPAGDGVKMDPQAKITRAEVASVLMRYVG